MGVNSNSRQCQTSSEWPTLSLSIWQLDHAHSNPSCQTSRYSEPASDLYWGLVSLTKSYFRYPQDSMMGHHGDWPDIRKRQVGYHDLATNSNHSLTSLLCFRQSRGPWRSPWEPTSCLQTNHAGIIFIQSFTLSAPGPSQSACKAWETLLILEEEEEGGCIVRVRADTLIA